MKKLFLFASAAALFATSCSDDLGLKNEQGGITGQGNCTLIATYPLGDSFTTRTQLEQDLNSNQNYYVWQEGDAIGVFNATTSGADATNAAFTYTAATGTQAASFNGDLMALKNGNYFGYYPYNASSGFTMSNNEIYLSIKANQNYNHEVVTNQTWGLNPPSGSFSQNTAPAVATGYATDDNKLEMTFQPVAAYFVFPIKNYGASTVTVNSLTLQVTDPSASSSENDADAATATTTEYQYLAGNFTVDFTEVIKGYTYYEIDHDNATTGSEQAQQAITLNCGRGVQLKQGEAANFWFVVPSGLRLPGANIQCTVSTSAGTMNISKPLGTGPNVPQVAGMNNVWKIVPESNTAWAFNSDPNAIYIQNQSQFLEYAYLVTKGLTAVTQYVEMAKKYPSMTKFSSLPDMVVMENGKTIDELTGSYTGSDFTWEQTGIQKVKNAVIATNINLDYTALTKQLAAQGLNLGAVNVPYYYQNVYSNFVSNKGVIAPIGGKFKDINISGLTSSTQISNLQVKGTGLFADSSNEYVSMYVNNLTLNNAQVTSTLANNAAYYYLLASPSNVYFSNVTVTGANTSVKGGNTNAKSVLFGTDNSGWYNYTRNNALVSNTTDVSNQTDLGFAYNLWITSNQDQKVAYDFTPVGHNVDDFYVYYLQGNEGATRYAWGTLLKVPNGEQNALALMKMIDANTGYASNAATPYSVVDNTTSYWTGRTTNNGWRVLGTAEYLAYVVREGGNGAEFSKAGYNIDLMCKNAEYPHAGNLWWNNGSNITISGTSASNPLVVSNVYMNGLKSGSAINNTGSNVASMISGDETYVFLTLVGNGSKANNLKIENMLLAPVNKLDQNRNVMVAAISSYPTSASLNNSAYMEVQTSNVETWQGIEGGLYCQLTGSNYNYLVNTTNYNPTLTVGPVEGESGDNLTGYLAGELAYTVIASANKVTIANPVKNPTNAAGEYRKPFGIAKITIDATSRQTTTIVLKGFGTQFITADNINNLVTVVNYAGYYSFWLQQDGQETVWTYVPATATVPAHIVAGSGN